MINAITHNQHNTKINKKHQHYCPPRPSASSGFNFIGECNCRLLHDWSQSLQHGDVIFIDETNIFFILLTIILQASDRHARELKVSFWSDYLLFFLAVASRQCTLTSAVCWYFCCRCIPSSCHVLPWFCIRRGGDTMVAMFTLSLAAAQVGCAS